MTIHEGEMMIVSYLRDAVENQRQYFIEMIINEEVHKKNE
jgi:hypothetical protein